MKRNRAAAGSPLFLFFLLSLAGCATVGPALNPLEREVLNAPERVMSEEEAARIVDQALGKEGILYQNTFENYWINDIVSRLAKSSHSDQSRFNLRLVKNQEPNAFSIGGKYLFVHEGLIKAANGQSDLIAGVLAHEMAHDLAGHQQRQAKAVTWIMAANLLVGMLTDKEGIQTGAAAASALALLKFSRSQEKEADILGTVYAYRAGYNPYGLAHFFEILEKKKPLPLDSLISFISTHPSRPDRIRTVKLVIDYLEGRKTLEQIAVEDSKTAKVLDSVERLDILKSGAQVISVSTLWQGVTAFPNAAIGPVQRFFSNDPQVFADEEWNLLEKETRAGMHFRIPERMTISLHFRAERGPEANFWLADAPACREIEADPKASKRFVPRYPELYGIQVQDYFKSVSLPPGDYCFVAANPNPAKHLPSSSKIRLRLLKK